MNNKFCSAVCFIRKYFLPDERNNTRVVEKQNLLNQIKTYRQHNIKATYLLQYDALIDDFYSDVIKKENNDTSAEIGVWLEIVRPLAENASVHFRGRSGYMWDYHTNAGFSCAYEYEEKIKLVDELMKKFKATYGHYPKTVGSWIIDSATMEYIDKKYSPDLFVICREQWGMDGYTLWGGPYYGLYYPCKNNMQCPAQTMEEQINTPVIRMFVNDPIYSYYEHTKEIIYGQFSGLFTQEPAWKCGSDPKWVKWHYDTLFHNENIGFCYTQLGQENSFDWTKFQKGFEHQVDFALSNKDKYGFEFVTLSELGKRFKSSFSTTPATGRYVLSDWENTPNASIWYNSKYYRVNICAYENEIFIRDIHLFDENYKDRYLTEPCNTPGAIYTTLPIMDGVRFGDKKTRASIKLGNGSITKVEQTRNNYKIYIKADENNYVLTAAENKLLIESNKDFELQIDTVDNTIISATSSKRVDYIYDGYKYCVNLFSGTINSNRLLSKKSKIGISFPSTTI